MIPPFDHPDVIAGQGTIGLEILEQRPDVGTILVPVSGGGLIAGISVGRRGARAGRGSHRGGARGRRQADRRARRRRARARWSAPRAWPTGCCPASVGALTFDLLRRVVRGAVTVTEEEIAAAVRYLHHEIELRPEPSGAVAVAALLAGRRGPPGPTVAVVSGGNVDPDLYQRLVG